MNVRDRSDFARKIGAPIVVALIQALVPAKIISSMSGQFLWGVLGVSVAVSLIFFVPVATAVLLSSKRPFWWLVATDAVVWFIFALGVAGVAMLGAHGGHVRMSALYTFIACVLSVATVIGALFGAACSWLATFGRHT